MNNVICIMLCDAMNVVKYISKISSRRKMVLATSVVSMAPCSK
jgi:hypothetical protein